MTKKKSTKTNSAKNTKKEFTPTIRTEKILDIKGFHKLDKLKDKDGKIVTKINQETAVKALSQKLYRNAESGFRELLNNEIRACQIAKDKYGSKNAYIRVSLDTTDRSLIIHGINSQGITTEVLNVLREIGLSITESKKGGRIPFGMGFYASLKLSDIVTVHTRCIENKESYGVQLRGGLFFQEIQDADFKKTGTRIKVTLKPKTNYEKIIDTLKEVSKTSGVKTYLELKAHNGKISGFESGVHELPRTSIRKIFDKTQDRDFSFLTASVDNNEVEAYLSIAIDSGGELQDGRKKELFLVNSPIEAILDEDDYDNYDYEAKNDDEDDEDDYNYDNDDEDEKQRIKYVASKIDDINFYSVVVNMKKESVFPAMQDRERLDPRGEKKLREVVVQLYNEALTTIKPCHTLEDWYDHDHKYFISSDKKDLIDLDESLDQKTKKLRTLLNTKVFTYNQERDRGDFRSIKGELDDFTFIDQKQTLFYALKKDKRIYNILKDNLADHYLCLIDENKFIQNNINIKKGHASFIQTKNILEHYGFVNAKEYIKENRLKRIVEEKEEEEEEEEDTATYVTIHARRFTSHQRQYDVLSNNFDEIKSDLIKLKSYSKYEKLIKEFDNEIYLVVDEPNIEQLNDIKDIKKIYDKTKNKKYLTNFGKLSVQEILELFKKSTDILINEEIEKSEYGLLVHVPKKAKRDKRVSQLYIVGQDTDQLENLAIILIENNRKYKVVRGDTDLDQYYRRSLDDLEDSVEDLVGITEDDKDYEIDEDAFEDEDKPIEAYESYLNSINEINEKVRNITLRELFQKSHNEDNYEEVIDKVLKLNKQIETSKIKRKEKNYL